MGSKGLHSGQSTVKRAIMNASTPGNISTFLNTKGSNHKTQIHKEVEYINSATQGTACVYHLFHFNLLLLLV